MAFSFFSAAETSCVGSSGQPSKVPGSSFTPSCHPEEGDSPTWDLLFALARWHYTKWTKSFPIVTRLTLLPLTGHIHVDNSKLSCRNAVLFFEKSSVNDNVNIFKSGIVDEVRKYSI
jgi:hypothetical protein